MWTIYVDWDGDFDFNAPSEAIWPDVVEASWRLGMRAAYQSVADENTCTLTLRNTDGKYNPENTASPLYGQLVPQRLVKISATVDGQEVPLWRGWIDSIEPEWQRAGAQTGETVAKIECIGGKGYLSRHELNLPLQQNKTADQIIDLALQRAALPPAVGGVWILGQSRLGIDTRLAAQSDYADLDTGLATIGTYGDVRGEGETKTAYKVIQEVTEAERGRFFFARDGKAVFWNRHHLILNSQTLTATLDTSGALGARPTAIAYHYGDDLVNSVAVTAYPRKTTGSSTLWALDTALDIGPGSTLELEAPYTVDGQPAGGANVTPTGAVFSQGSGTVTLDESAERALLSIANSGTNTATLSGLALEGDALTSHNQIVIRAQDDESIAQYGRRAEMRLNLQALEDADLARQIAETELARRSTPVGHIRNFEMTRAPDGAYLDWTLGTRVRLAAPELGHAAEYFIMGEAHRIGPGLATHTAKYTLEPANANAYWVLGVSQLGIDTRLGY